MISETVTPQLLHKCAHLSDLTMDALAKLATIADDVVVASGARVFSDMDPADTFYLLIKGEVNLCCEMGSGELRVMDTVNEGELFAWSALVEPHRYTSTAVAASDCELITFDAHQLRELCQEDIDLGYQVFHKVVELLTNRLESARIELAAS